MVETDPNIPVSGVLKSCEIDLKRLPLSLSVSVSKFICLFFSYKSSLSIAKAICVETDSKRIFSFFDKVFSSKHAIPIIPRILFCPLIG